MGGLCVCYRPSLRRTPKYVSDQTAEIAVDSERLRTVENILLAEGVGFEPTVPLRARRFSRPVP